MALRKGQAEDDNVIYKTPESLGFVPNMPDYDLACRQVDWAKAAEELAWFNKGKLNAAYSAVDRHALSDAADKVAMHWIGADGRRQEYTFLDLSKLSNRFANALVDLGIGNGDRVFIFTPRIPELYIAFLGILKVGAIATTVFSAFGSEALRDRLVDAEASLVLTTPELAPRLAAARAALPNLKVMLVGELSYRKAIETASDDFAAVETAPDDYAFMLYTSGTTGKPKGVIHTHMALVQQHLSAKWVLDLKDDDVYWCTADPGWVTGVSYGLLGPWSNGVTQVVFEGRFDPGAWYRIIEDYKVSVWYTAPTAIRMLMRAGDELPTKYDLSSLRHINSVGEPLNPEAIRWGLKAFGLPFHDNWWQTETGSILVANYPALPIKLGSMGKPFPGIEAEIVDDKADILPVGIPGNLAFKPGWPSMFAGIWKDEDRYRSYFVGEWYLSGDKAYKDVDGYFWFIGRADDVIKTAGERVGPFEVESALIEHEAIVEAGVIGKPDPLRGEIVKAFVVLRSGVSPSPELQQEIQKFVKQRLAGHAYPREIEYVASLPKTRSGKIMRRILKAKELGLPVGDTSALEEE